MYLHFNFTIFNITVQVACVAVLLLVLGLATHVPSKFLGYIIGLEI